MEKVVVSGVPPFDGEYPIDLSFFTMRELNIIKRVAGVRAGEAEEAIAAGDSDMTVAISVLAVRRNEKDWQAFEALVWEAQAGSITLDVEDEGAAVPLIPSSQPAGSDVSEAPPGSSGLPLSGDGEDLPETNLPATGSLRSVTGAA